MPDIILPLFSSQFKLSDKIGAGRCRKIRVLGTDTDALQTHENSSIQYTSTTQTAHDTIGLYSHTRITILDTDCAKIWPVKELTQTSK